MAASWFVEKRAIVNVLSRAYRVLIERAPYADITDICWIWENTHTLFPTNAALLVVIKELASLESKNNTVLNTIDEEDHVCIDSSPEAWWSDWVLYD